VFKGIASKVMEIGGFFLYCLLKNHFSFSPHYALAWMGLTRQHQTL